MLGKDRWVRFDRYEIADGRIRVCRGAIPEFYSPRSEHEKLRNGANRLKSEPSAYERLLDIAQKIQSSTPDSAAETLILDWCSEFGLLGLLHQDFVSLRIPGASGEIFQAGGVWDIFSMTSRPTNHP